MAVNNNGVANVNSGWDSGAFVVLGNDNSTELIRVDGVANTVSVSGVTVTNGGDATFQDITATGDISGNFIGTYYYGGGVSGAFDVATMPSGVYVVVDSFTDITLNDPGVLATGIKLFRFVGAGGGYINLPYDVDNILFYSAPNTLASSVNNVNRIFVAAGGYVDILYGRSISAPSKYLNVLSFNGATFDSVP